MNKERTLSRLRVALGLLFSQEFVENCEIVWKDGIFTKNMALSLFKSVWAEEIDKIEFQSPASDDPSVTLTHTITLYKAYPQIEDPKDIFDHMAGVLKLRHYVYDPREFNSESPDDQV